MKIEFYLYWTAFVNIKVLKSSLKYTIYCSRASYFYIKLLMPSNLGPCVLAIMKSIGYLMNLYLTKRQIVQDTNIFKSVSYVFQYSFKPDIVLVKFHSSIKVLVIIWHQLYYRSFVSNKWKDDNFKTATEKRNANVIWMKVLLFLWPGDNRYFLSPDTLLFPG